LCSQGWPPGSRRDGELLFRVTGEGIGGGPAMRATKWLLRRWMMAALSVAMRQAGAADVEGDMEADPAVNTVNGQSSCQAKHDLP
jgi:hypothetical protein